MVLSLVVPGAFRAIGQEAFVGKSFFGGLMCGKRKLEKGSLLCYFAGGSDFEQSFDY